MYLDPIAELITKINNGRKAHKAEVSFATSKLKTAILELLVKEDISNLMIFVQLKTINLKQLLN